MAVNMDSIKLGFSGTNLFRVPALRLLSMQEAPVIQEDSRRFAHTFATLVAYMQPLV